MYKRLIYLQTKYHLFAKSMAVLDLKNDLLTNTHMILLMYLLVYLIDRSVKLSNPTKNHVKATL